MGKVNYEFMTRVIGMAVVFMTTITLAETIGMELARITVALVAKKYGL